MERSGSNRDSRLELIRIISMLLIMSYHCVKFTLGSNYNFLEEPPTLNYYFSLGVILIGSIGTYLFIILTCWFSVDKVSFKAERVVRTLWQTWTTCILSIMLAWILNIHSLSLKNILLEIVTPYYGQYWFITAFIVFSLILPFLQLLLFKLNDKAIRFICVMLLIAGPIRAFFTTDLLGDLGDFITVFFVIAYLKRHQENWIEKHSKLGMIMIFIFILIIICARAVLPAELFGRNLNGGKGSLFVALIRHIRFMTVIQLIGALFVFYTLKQINLKPSKAINLLSKSAFAVYLWHYNIMFRGWIWQKVFFAEYLYKETNLYCVLLVFGPIILYCVLSVVETFRAFVFDKLLYNLLPWNRRVISFIDKHYEWCKSQ